MGRRKKRVDDELVQESPPTEIQLAYAQCCEEIAATRLDTLRGRNDARSSIMKALILATSDQVTNKSIFQIAPHLTRLIDGAAREVQLLLDDSAEDNRRAAIQELSSSIDARRGKSTVN